VGSLSNIADYGMVEEEGRAATHEFDIASGTDRNFASGLRNAAGTVWEPSTGGAVDGGKRARWAGRRNTARLGAGRPHGISWPVLAARRYAPRLSRRLAIGQHGSWNCSTLSSYKLVFVPFVNGRPSGAPRNILSGFLAPDEKESYGRPAGATIGSDGSVLMADDVNGQRNLARHRRVATTSASSRRRRTNLCAVRIRYREATTYQLPLLRYRYSGALPVAEIG